MIQNTIALSLVTVAAGYTIYSFVKGITSRKAGKCGGCTGCSFNQTSQINRRTL
ncbi:MAG TPA: FeoB-associated Cys-rich membrane protein [Bacteroidales bacterium]